MPGHLDKLGIILNLWMTCHFTVQSGMMPTVRVESKGPWGRLSLSPWLISSEVSSIPSMSRAGIPAGRMWPPARLTRRLRWVWPLVGTFLFPVPLPSLLGPEQAALVLVSGLEIPLPFQISLQLHAFAPSLPRPCPHLQMALRKLGRGCPVHSF